MFKVLTISTRYCFFLVRKVCLVTDRYGNDMKSKEEKEDSTFACAYCILVTYLVLSETLLNTVITDINTNLLLWYLINTFNQK